MKGSAALPSASRSLPVEVGLACKIFGGSGVQPRSRKLLILSDQNSLTRFSVRLSQTPIYEVLSELRQKLQEIDAAIAVIARLEKQQMGIEPLKRPWGRPRKHFAAVRSEE